jgi:hypothetical protein
LCEKFQTWSFPQLQNAFFGLRKNLKDSFKDVTNQLSDTQIELEDTRNQLGSTKNDLAATKDELAITKSDLTAAKSDLTATKSQLAATKSDLITTKSDLTATKSDLTATKSELTAIKSDLITTKYELVNRLQALEKVASPFFQQGVIVLWKKPANLIPSGWAEVSDLRGRMPIGWDSSDPSFAEINKEGGSKTHVLTVGQMPPHSHPPGFNAGKGDGLKASGGVAVDRAGSNGGFSASEWTASVGNGLPVDHMNPYRVVMFIEYIGN